jgi:hypothetical protein
MMAEGYCVKCKARQVMSETVEVTMKNGRRAIKGKCPVCSTVIFKFRGGATGSELSSHALSH